MGEFKNHIAMEYYFKSDFSIVETFTDAEGNPINLNDFDFELIYQTTGVNNYRVSKKGTTFTHCSIDEADTSKLNVIFQDHRLGCGKLHREISIKVCNPLFKDYQLVVTHPFTEITLVQNGGDQTTGCARAGIPVVIPLTPSVIDDIADADSFLGISALGVFFKTTWLNIKAKLKAYFDTIYASITHNHNLNDLAEKSYNSLTDRPSLDFEPANENIQLHIGDGDIHVTSTEKSTWSGKQDALTFSTDIETDKASTTKISAIKTFYDWAVGKFIDLTKIVTSWNATTLDTNIPSEKLVKDSLNLKADIAPANGATSALRALFTSVPFANCVYNTATGYYEMNGITDLTELDVTKSYHFLQAYKNQSSGAYQGSGIRTNFYLGNNANSNYNCRSWCQVVTTLEVFKFHSHNIITSTQFMFYGCSLLRTAETFRMTSIMNADNALNMFYECVSLETAYLRELKVSFSFEWSPLLSLASLQYLVTNRANGTTRITITVHPTVWSKLNDAVNYPEWNAFWADAVADEYIDFATV